MKKSCCFFKKIVTTEISMYKCLFFQMMLQIDGSNKIYQGLFEIQAWVWEPPPQSVRPLCKGGAMEWPFEPGHNQGPVQQMAGQR
jgi:hypothetical protein